MSAWGYLSNNGPCHWAKDFPDASGKRQSPIDIQTSQARYDGALKANPLKTQYSEGNDFDVSNSGHSLVVSRKTKEGHQLSGGPLKHNYRFEQFHLHWGKTSKEGSEHTLNGKTFPAELHLVHWNCDLYSSFGEAASKPDGLAVLGAFVQIGGESAAMKKITDMIPSVQNIGAKQDLKSSLNLACMLPSNTKDYWTYSGSLTTPPCYESVSWFVFKEPVTATEAQMKQFRSLKSKDGGCIAGNFRPVMPVGERSVRASFQ